jgi:hypothetical protein
MMASTSGELQGLGLWSFSPLGCGYARPLSMGGGGGSTRGMPLFTPHPQRGIRVDFFIAPCVRACVRARACRGPRVKMALYSHDDDGESGSAQARACSTKGRPHLLLAVRIP